MGISLKKAFALVLTICVALTAMGPVTVRAAPDAIFPSGEGEGTQAKPYQITNAAELGKLSELVNAKNTAYNGAYYLLIDDIDLSDFDSDDDPANGNWTPIGGQNAYFYGHFNGGGHAISNLSIILDESVSSYSYQGLFGNLSQATVSNVYLEALNITSPKSYAVGGIAGHAYGSTITGCSVSGSIAVRYRVGGIAGELIGGSVTGCWADIKVSGSDRVGGIVGDISSGDISVCYSKGRITSSDSADGILGEGLWPLSASAIPSAVSREPRTKQAESLEIFITPA